MNYKRTLFFHLIALMANVSSGFAPVRTPMTITSPGIGPTQTSIKSRPSTKVVTTKKNFSGTTTTSSSLAATPDPDLIVGFVTIAAACTPYALGTVFPTFFDDNFFLPIYKADESGRIAEIGWKVRYATLGLVLTTLTFLEVFVSPDIGAVGVLRDSYIVWAIFYVEATRKIRAEATSDPPILANPSGRLGIQLWHVSVTIVLWACVSESYTGQAITNFLRDLFT